MECVMLMAVVKYFLYISDAYIIIYVAFLLFKELSTQLFFSLFLRVRDIGLPVTGVMHLSIRNVGL